MLARTIVMVGLLSICQRVAADDGLRRQALDGLHKGVAYFRNEVATEGGYLWRYSADLTRREGEGKADDRTVWVQPPGTPAVGMALLEAWRATGDSYYLEAARAAGDCLVRGQVRSGGWDYRIPFDPEERRRYDFRVDPPSRGKRVRRITVLDDNTTQSALRLLVHLDQALQQKDAKIHEAAGYALKSLLDAQYPNGAWPQGFEGPPDAAKYPVLKASYPESWSRTYVKSPYHLCYTLNDDVLADMVEVLFETGRIYAERRYTEAAAKVGDFLIGAQMPMPQPAWAQQYDAAMHPVWARKFEPPAVTGGESQGALRTLLAIYAETGDRKYLAPIPRAIEYLRKSQLANGQLARFYELHTNRPLYFTRQYELTYDDGDMPTHYAFKVGQSLDAIQRDYGRLFALKPEDLKAPAKHRAGKPSQRLIEQVKQTLAQQDQQGRWVEKGPLRYQGEKDSTREVIDCQTFIRHVRTLSAYLGATSP